MSLVRAVFSRPGNKPINNYKMFLIKKLNTKIILSILFVLFFCYQSFCQSNQIDGFEIPRLSPRPATVANVQQSQISLNGKWDFQISGQAAQHAINVPGEWEMQGFTVNEEKPRFIIMN